jgi:hypothetical protein
MGKKKRVRKCTVFGIVEGDRELKFLQVLSEKYGTEENQISLKPENAKGGGPNVIVNKAIIESHRDRSFAWFDEDFEPKYPVGEDIRNKLASCWNVIADHDFLKCPPKDLQAKNIQKRKPFIIVSQPVCVEALILNVLNRPIPDNCKDYQPSKRAKQIESLKDELERVIGNIDEVEFYRANLSKDLLDKKRLELSELDHLLLMIEKSES